MYLNVALLVLLLFQKNKEKIACVDCESSRAWPQESNPGFAALNPPPFPVCHTSSEHIANTYWYFVCMMSRMIHCYRKLNPFTQFNLGNCSVNMALQYFCWSIAQAGFDNISYVDGSNTARNNFSCRRHHELLQSNKIPRSSG